MKSKLFTAALVAGIVLMLAVCGVEELVNG